MPRIHATPNGNIPFTEEEEAQWDAKESAWEAGALQRAIDVKLEQLSNLALEKENSGITVNTLEIATDRESIGRLTAALSMMGRNQSEAIDFKAKNGFASANKAALEAIQDAAWTHVKSVNAQHKTHYDAIKILTEIEAVKSYDITTGW